MGQLLRFPLSDGGEVIVEVTEEPGLARAGRAGGAIATAATTYEEAIGRIRRTADATLRQFRQMTSQPSFVEIEFGVRLTAEAGAVIARTEAEAQLTVRLAWTNEPAGQ